MFVDRKEAMPPENMQLRLRKSASPDHHGLEVMIFVTAVEIVYMLVCTLECEIWRNGCLLLDDLLIFVFTMTCPTRMHFFYLEYFQIATSHMICFFIGRLLKRWM
jgi:hypothetical protein